MYEYEKKEKIKLKEREKEEKKKWKLNCSSEQQFIIYQEIYNVMAIMFKARHETWI